MCLGADAQSPGFRADLLKTLAIAQAPAFLLLGGHIGGQGLVNQVLFAARWTVTKSIRQQTIVNLDVRPHAQIIHLVYKACQTVLSLARIARIDCRVGGAHLYSDCWA
jgi:hypothetical protein